MYKGEWFEEGFDRPHPETEYVGFRFCRVYCTFTVCTIQLLYFMTIVGIDVYKFYTLM